MEVFPTPWSPKNTNLYFARGEAFGEAPGGAVSVDCCGGKAAGGVDAIVRKLAQFEFPWKDQNSISSAFIKLLSAQRRKQSSDDSLCSFALSKCLSIGSLFEVKVQETGNQIQILYSWKVHSSSSVTVYVYGFLTHPSGDSWGIYSIVHSLQSTRPTIFIPFLQFFYSEEKLSSNSLEL